MLFSISSDFAVHRELGLFCDWLTFHYVTTDLDSAYISTFCISYEKNFNIVIVFAKILISVIILR